MGSHSDSGWPVIWRRVVRDHRVLQLLAETQDGLLLLPASFSHGLLGLNQARLGHIELLSKVFIFCLALHSLCEHRLCRQ